MRQRERNLWLRIAVAASIGGGALGGCPSGGDEPTDDPSRSAEIQTVPGPQGPAGPQGPEGESGPVGAPATGQYTLSGTMVTSLNGHSIETPFSFPVVLN